MLTRLKVSGFKNLVDTEVWFGPFTCIAGANGVGKSNLLDAIAFLAALTDKPLLEAALSVRDEGRRTGDARAIFYRSGDSYADRMRLEADIIVAPAGTDDLGQPARATNTFLRYSIELRYRSDAAANPLELTHEELAYIRKGDAPKSLPFPYSREWFESAVKGRRFGTHYISTEGDEVKVHQDGGSSGRPRRLKASTLPRTALSSANAAESPTAALARSEMRSWRRLQLEPSKLREPDPFSAPAKVESDGSHLPATLYRLAHGGGNGPGVPGDSRQVYTEIANRLAELIHEVRTVEVDRDERRELLTLIVTGRDRTKFPARALSDGTLRFLALAVLSADPENTGLICLEEPENGIHPERVGAMVNLLTQFAVRTNEEVDEGNPLRQVIVNTHSPAVVQCAPDDSLVLAEWIEKAMPGGLARCLSLRGLESTWRAGTGPVVAIGKILSYLNPVSAEPSGEEPPGRVIDRQDVRQLRLFGDRPC